MDVAIEIYGRRRGRHTEIHEGSVRRVRRRLTLYLGKRLSFETRAGDHRQQQEQGSNSDRKDW